jgi:hypothetical protein
MVNALYARLSPRFKLKSRELHAFSGITLLEARLTNPVLKPHIHPLDSRMASDSARICELLCEDDNAMRMRAEPRATVGYRIAGARNPRR